MDKAEILAFLNVELKKSSETCSSTNVGSEAHRRGLDTFEDLLNIYRATNEIFGNSDANCLEEK